ncbi:MAG: hypothetical protein OEM60_09400 [Gammaproteobacteria bacterium]|nr:hypothetical protein [Gammaproteobacteria bacterium]MDH3430161.1 hypothetical protein [Gammaproteobacteria bacterium]MDH3434061.1 hypothetical protein [Gammaproteobacteria bacterium]
MKSPLIRHLNEIVGLTIMAMMAWALVAGQAEAMAQAGAAEQGRALIEIRLTIDE